MDAAAISESEWYDPSKPDENLRVNPFGREWDKAGGFESRNYDIPALVEFIANSILQREGDAAGFSKSESRSPYDLLANLKDRFFLKKLYAVEAADQ